MRLKVLPLQPYMHMVKATNSLDLVAPGLEKVAPIFNREGFYLLGQQCWFEVEGNGYVHHGIRSDFLYRLNKLNQVKVNSDTLKELKLTVSKLPRAQRSNFMATITEGVYEGDNPYVRLLYAKYKIRKMRKEIT